MQRRLATLVIPAFIAAFSCAPAVAQIRIGLDLGAVHVHIAPEAPPPPRQEVILVRPSRRHVWIGGYWDRQDDRWAWAPGRWEEPSERGSYWIKPRYRGEGGAYRYEPGRWSHQRMEEGDDYRSWKEKRHGRGQGKHRGEDREDRRAGDGDDHRRHR